MVVFSSSSILLLLFCPQLAMDCLGWSDNAAAQLVMEGYVKLTQPGELLLTTTRSRGRTLKWQNVWMGLVTLNHHQVWGFAFIIHFPSKHSHTLSLSSIFCLLFLFSFLTFSSSST